MEIPWNGIATGYFGLNAIITIVVLLIITWRVRAKTKSDLIAYVMGVPVALSIGIFVVLYVLASERCKKVA